MDIKRAKQEIKDAVEAYLLKDAFGEYRIPAIRQRPILLMGPPGIGKTQVMEQIAKEMKIGLVSYTRDRVQWACRLSGRKNTAAGHIL